MLYIAVLILFLCFVVLYVYFYLFLRIFFLLRWKYFLRCFFWSIFLHQRFLGLIFCTIHVWSWILEVFGLKHLFLHLYILLFYLYRMLCQLLYNQHNISLNFLLQLLRILYRVLDLLSLVSKGVFCYQHQLQ